MCPQKILQLSLEVDVGAKAFLVPIEQGMGIRAAVAPPTLAHRGLDRAQSSFWGRLRR